MGARGRRRVSYQGLCPYSPHYTRITPLPSATTAPRTNSTVNPSTTDTAGPIPGTVTAQPQALPNGGLNTCYSSGRTVTNSDIVLRQIVDFCSSSYRTFGTQSSVALMLTYENLWMFLEVRNGNCNHRRDATFQGPSETIPETIQHLPTEGFGLV